MFWLIFKFNQHIMKTRLFASLIVLIPALGLAQQTPRPRVTDSARAAQKAAALKKYESKVFTRADSLRGSITPERAWWDVLRYDITIKPDFAKRYTSGKNLITYKVVQDTYPLVMQIDLREPLNIDSVVYNGKRKLNFTREGNAWHVQTVKQAKGAVNTVEVYFSGKPTIAARPPAA